MWLEDADQAQARLALVSPDTDEAGVAPGGTIDTHQVAAEITSYPWGTHARAAAARARSKRIE